MPETKVVVGVASPNQKIEFVGDPQTAPRFYANHAVIQTSQFDVRIQCNQIVEQTADKTTVVPQLILHMSHLHARVLADVIQGHLKSLQEQLENLPELLKTGKAESSQ